MRAPWLEVLVGARLHVVEVEEGEAVERARGRVDVARHGEVDDEQVAALARGQRASEVVARHYRLRRRRRAEHDVRMDQLAVELLEPAAHAAVGGRGETGGLLRAAAEHDDLDAVR